MAVLVLDINIYTVYNVYVGWLDSRPHTIRE
jgi:hypothetical protein